MAAYVHGAVPQLDFEVLLFRLPVVPRSKLRQLGGEVQTQITVAVVCRSYLRGCHLMLLLFLARWTAFN